MKFNQRYDILEFRRFPSLRTGDDASYFLKDVVLDWDLGEEVMAITKNSASDMVNKTGKLSCDLNEIASRTHTPIFRFFRLGA